MAKCRKIFHFCVFQFQVIKEVEEGFRLPAPKVSIVPFETGMDLFGKQRVYVALIFQSVSSLPAFTSHLPHYFRGVEKLCCYLNNFCT